MAIDGIIYYIKKERRPVMKKIFGFILLLLGSLCTLSSCIHVDEPGPPYGPNDSYNVPYNTLMYVEYVSQRTYLDANVSIYYSGGYWTLSGAWQIGVGRVLYMGNNRIELDARPTYNSGYLLNLPAGNGAILESEDYYGRPVFYTVVYQNGGFYFVKTSYNPLYY